MTDAVILARKLSVLREHLDRLRRRRPETPEELRQDVDRLDALSMSVLVVVQEAIDIAFHIASDAGWPLPATYREGFTLLADKGVIPAPLARELAGAVRLRNRNAHGYASIDVETLWRDLPSGILAFDELAKLVAPLLTPGP
jgi:uncharacterized protein YutE (UPF0331/DUF86 family)